MINDFSDYVKLSKTIPDEVMMNIPQIDDPQRLADTIAAHMVIKNVEKQKILETATLEEQLTVIAKLLTEEIEIMEPEP